MPFVYGSHSSTVSSNVPRVLDLGKPFAPNCRHLVEENTPVSALHEDIGGSV